MVKRHREAGPFWCWLAAALDLSTYSLLQNCPASRCLVTNVIKNLENPFVLRVVRKLSFDVHLHIKKKTNLVENTLVAIGYDFSSVYVVGICTYIMKVPKRSPVTYDGSASTL